MNVSDQFGDKGDIDFFLEFKTENSVTGDTAIPATKEKQNDDKRHMKNSTY
jgi:hypothetical protein